MKRLSLAGWKDPVRRPRYIIWTGVGLFGIAAVLILAVSITSSHWFCTEVCHSVMDDAVAAYDHSAHANINCVACHAKVAANPVPFLIHKAEFGIDGVYKVATGTQPIPPNPESEVALETPMTQCTQCHAGFKEINPSAGMKIDHEAHKAEGIACTICHNRVAHKETGELILASSKKHVDFMQMEGCFRCHSQEPGAKAPGTCSACHTEDFNLVPSSHADPAFYTPYGDSTGHAEMAREDQARLAEVEAEEAAASTAEEPSAEKAEDELKPIEEVSYCGQCHAQKFCDDCHGTEIPHPAKFKEDHKNAALKHPEECGRCHANSKKEAATTEFCSDCHHKVGNTAKDWFPQHPTYAKKDVKACLKCHTTMYCETCHVSGQPKVPY